MADYINQSINQFI